MFIYNPNPEVTSLINTHNISVSSIWYDTLYNNLRYCNSNKINDMLHAVGGYYYYNDQGVTNAAYYSTLLLSKVLPSPQALPYFSGTSGRVSQDFYNRIRTSNGNLKDLLDISGFMAPRRRSGLGTKCINFIFVSSGFSLIRNFINATQGIERNTFYENLINNYRKNNLENLQEVPQTIVVNNIYPTSDSMQDSITIFTNKLDDKQAMHTILLMIQAHYAGALITSAAEQANIKNAIENDIDLPDITLQTKMAYYLTEFWERELQRNSTNLESTTTTIDTIQKTCLDQAFLMHFKNLVAEAPTLFLQNLSNRYNYDYRAKDEQALERAITDLEHYYAEIRELEHKKHTLQRKLAVLQNMDMDEIKEFWEAITLYKNIYVESTSNTALMLRILSPLTFYDEEDAKTVLNNPGSSALITVRNICEELSFKYDTVKAVLFDIFVNKKYQIHTFTRFKLSIGTNGSSDILYLQRDSITLKPMYDRIWQPHIMRYDCYGAARTNFNKEILNKQFDVAFGQLVGATQNLTVSDSTVFCHLLSTLIRSYNTVPTIYDPVKQNYCSFRDIYLAKAHEMKPYEEAVEDFEEEFEDEDEE